MAVLTMVRPDLAPGAVVPILLTPTAAQETAKLDFAGGLAQHQFKVALTADGATSQIDVLKAMSAALADGSASFWQEGPLATQARVEVPLAGSQRLIFDVTVFKGGGLSVEAQFNNDGAMAAVGGSVGYRVAVTMDGRVALDTTVSQAQYQNWHQSFSSDEHNGGQGLGSPSEGWLNIVHDVAHLQKAGAVGTYNLAIGVDEALLDRWGDIATAPGFDAPLATRDVTQFMPGVGGRGDIGLTTAVNTGWLMSQDARAAALAMGQAEAASSVPWHLWDAKNDTWLGTDAYPNLWTDPRGGTGTPGSAASGTLTQAMEGAGWDLDSAHQPDLSYVPYLMTGERWMLDNLQAQAAWNIMSLWPAPRGGDGDLVVQDNQVRGAAWSLRQIDEAAWASPDGSAEKTAFTEASAANWSWIVSQIPKWTAEQGEAHGWLPGIYGYDNVLPPWQQDYFASTAIAAAARGNGDALTYLDWASNFLVGRFTNAANGFPEHDGAAYLIEISDPATGKLYQTWAEIGAATAASGKSNGDGWSQTQGDYGQLALATLAGIANLTGSTEAAEAYRALMSNPPPFTSATDFMRDPTYALAAPASGAIVTVPPASPGTTPQPPPTGPVVVAPPPVDPVTDSTGPATPGLVKLSVVLGAESWQGDPEAVVLVDGVQAFRGVISAPHATGGTEVALGSFAADKAHQVTVRFLNDAWGGTATTDRNLHVEDILVNGASTGQAGTLQSAGDIEFNLAASPASGAIVPAPLPDEGSFTLRLGVSADAYLGNPNFQLFLDGQELGGVRAATASHTAGETQFLDLRGDITGGSQTLTVRFLNDAWGGTATTDRNLYVDSLTLDGISLNQRATLMSNGDATFNFTPSGGAPTSPTPTPSPTPEAPPAPIMLSGPIIGAGPDVLRIGVSGDAWKGTPHFAVLVDGVQIGGVQTTTASRAEDEESFLNILGDFSPGLHMLAVRFLDDAWSGRFDQDRNLYVESVEFNGLDLNREATLMSNGDAVFQF